MSSPPVVNLTKRRHGLSGSKPSRFYHKASSKPKLGPAWKLIRKQRRVKSPKADGGKEAWGGGFRGRGSPRFPRRVTAPRRQSRREPPAGEAGGFSVYQPGWKIVARAGFELPVLRAGKAEAEGRCPSAVCDTLTSSAYRLGALRVSIRWRLQVCRGRYGAAVERFSAGGGAVVVQ